jgi:hypothetical protein
VKQGTGKREQGKGKREMGKGKWEMGNGGIRWQIPGFSQIAENK